MRVRLGTFARAGLESQKADLRLGLQQALSHYTMRVSSGEAPAGFPAFRRDTSTEPAAAVLDVKVDREVEIALERECRRQRTTVDQLTTHAVFVFLADAVGVSHAA